MPASWVRGSAWGEGCTPWYDGRCQTVHSEMAETVNCVFHRDKKKRKIRKPGGRVSLPFGASGLDISCFFIADLTHGNLGESCRPPPIVAPGHRLRLALWSHRALLVCEHAHQTPEPVPRGCVCRSPWP